MKSLGAIALVVISLLCVFAWRDYTPVDRAQLARWLHQWQHDGTSVQVDLAAVLERWQTLQAQRLEQRLPPQNIHASELRRQDAPLMVTENDRTIAVNSSTSLLEAVKQANPGDRIVVAPGRYAFSGRSIELSRSGTATHPITIVAQQPWQSIFEFDLLEGFWIAGSDWHINGLRVQGVCATDDRCEHGFHIVAGAQRTALRNNRIEDFNAAIKINGSRGLYPDGGIISNNAIVNSRARQTTQPVVGVDGVAVSRWRVSNNVIANFKKAKGNRTSSGGFFKGAGQSNRFNNNLVICSDKVSMDYIQIGLSLGDGGTSASACRDRLCRNEQSDSDIMGNIIMNCSDVGIYLNRANRSTVSNNTLYATLGIDVRFESSSAVIVNNLVGGRIRQRDGAEITIDEHNWLVPAQARWRESFSTLFRRPQNLSFAVNEHKTKHFTGVRNQHFNHDVCGYPNDQSDGFIGAFNPAAANDCFSIAP